MAKELLSVYLQDHLAGALAGLELARRAAGNNDGDEYGRELAEICKQVEEDREALSDLMERLGVRPSTLKQGAAWMGERLGRLKPNGRVMSYSPLSRLVEIEGLVIGVSGKLELWRSLMAVADSDPALRAFDLKGLGERAEDQRRRLEKLHDRAAREALAR
jgi:hypothetical protein